jgi:hypothetical protein
MAPETYGVVNLLPALLAIVLMLITRQVIISLSARSGPGRRSSSAGTRSVTRRAAPSSSFKTSPPYSISDSSYKLVEKVWVGQKK